ncbi:MAG: MBL fold metallo-hydrolase [Tindallia sp. MSAO_Bac2]|nr:MAG: MBL fold metallo-hydrolase [Tindallia sp. MSAO_Bac2]
MKPMTSTITHFYHSGFSVETPNHFFIFDYVLPPDIKDNPNERIRLKPEYLSQKRNVFVFVSHHHNDHYMPEIFEWHHQVSGIQYVLSDDIQVKGSQNLHFVKPGDYLKINEVAIRTFGSTDEGVSFLVQSDQLTFFHSGDLNWWHWNNFSPDKQKEEETDFKRIIDLVCKYKIDVAFVPVDPRLEDAYFWAGKHFFEKVKPDLLIPMHFRDNFVITHSFSAKMNVPERSVARLNNRGESIFYSKSKV